jgi:hypothetical protein
MLPRQWLPLNPGTIVGTPANVPAPNPFGINWPAAQFANPSFVGSTVKFVPLPSIPVSERVGAGPMHWSWAQFGNGKKSLPRFAPNPDQQPPEVLYSGPDFDPVATARNLAPGILTLAAVAVFVVYADRMLSPER